MRKLLAPLVAALLWPTWLPAQTPDVPPRIPSQPAAGKRIRVGLALSGGSALGLAHLGVIHWMEEHRIPIDAIAGTSMGALVGALYATGDDYGHMEHFIDKLNWEAALSTNPPFTDLAFRRKQDDREYPSPLEFGYKGGIRIPSGLSSGHGVALFISRIAAAYGQMDSFDNLPTPFRCVASDLISGKQVVFDKGSLPDALRATMSLPALFAPVRTDKMLLVDGGLVNNLPVDLVKKMNVDVVIAVVLNPPAPDPKESTTLFSVARRSLTVMIADNERRNIGLADLVVMPNLDGVFAGDYNHWKEFADRGYAAAENKGFFLSKLALSEADYAEWQKQRLAKRHDPTIHTEVVEIDPALPNRRRDALLDQIAGSPDKTVSPEKMERELTKLTGMGRYDAGNYTLISRNDLPGIRIKLHEKEHGPPFLKPLFQLEASPEENLRFGVGGRVTFLDLGGPASEWRTDLSIGVFNVAQTEYYYRVLGSKWFIAPRIGYRQKSTPFFEDKRNIADLKQRQTEGGIDLGYAFGRFQELRAGWVLGHNVTELSNEQPGIAAIRGRYSRIRGLWSYEGQDRPVVPSHGIRANIEGSWYTASPGVDGGFPSIQGELAYARPISKRWISIYRVAGGATKADPSLQFQFLLGGPLAVSALGRGELYGSHYYYGSAAALRALSADSLSLFGRFYTYLGYEGGNAWTTESIPVPRSSATMGIVGETVFGAVFFGGAIGDRGDKRVFFRLGRFF